MNKQIEQGSADGVESTIPAQPGITDTVAIPLGEFKAAAQPVQQPAPIAEPHYEAGRKQGRAEALSILMGLCPETGIDDYTGWSNSGAPEDEGSAHWQEDKLRKLFGVDGELADMMDKAEEQYWKYLGMQDEANRARNFAANMHSSSKVRDVLAKAGEYDPLGRLCAAPVPATSVDKVAFHNDGSEPDWVEYAAEEARDAVTSARVQPFQQRVQPWMMACFGAEISADTKERNHRFFEESTELVQACGMTASEAHQLVDYVYGRPVGEPALEVGGVMVTLAALCLANGLDLDAAAETELARIWTKVEAIRAKQAAKPKHSPLPQAVQPGNGRDAALLEQAAQACDQQADGTNGPYRSACLQCANALRALRDTVRQSNNIGPTSQRDLIVARAIRDAMFNGWNPCREDSDLRGVLAALDKRGA